MVVVVGAGAVVGAAVGAAVGAVAVVGTGAVAVVGVAAGAAVGAVAVVGAGAVVGAAVGAAVGAGAGAVAVVGVAAGAAGAVAVVGAGAVVGAVAVVVGIVVEEELEEVAGKNGLTTSRAESFAGLEDSSELTIRFTRCGMSGHTNTGTPALVGCQKATLRPRSIPSKRVSMLMSGRTLLRFSRRK